MALFMSPALHATGKIPAKGFIENKGQILDQNYASNNDVLFLYTGKGLKVQLKKNGYSYELYALNNSPEIHPSKKTADIEQLSKISMSGSRVDLDFLGMNPDFSVKTDAKNQGCFNYSAGGKEIAGVSSYNKITYMNIYPATDIEFLITENEAAPFKYNIVLHPGADLSKIKFLCGGADRIIKTNDNGISFSTPLGSISESIPFSYYTDAPSENKPVSFTIENNTISFSASYDRNKTLIIDPSTNRIWGTYFGGTSTEYCTATATDGTSAVYIAGYTSSASSIASAGAYQSTLSGSLDAYIAKFDLSGAFIWGTYFGGSGIDIFYALHVDPSGYVYASGDSNSTSNVASPGAHQTVYGGGIDDAVFAKFDPNGLRLWSTYYGGTMHDISVTITVDNNKDVVFAGHTESTGAIATPGAYNTIFSAGYDVFVAKFDSSGVRKWGTYYGDTGTEEAFSVDVDASNTIYITGFTNSLFGISTGSAWQSINGGNTDAFAATFDASGSSLLYGTYYGGTGDDQGTAIKVNNTGIIYITGNTTSPNNMSSPGAHQTSQGSSDDGFLACFTAAGVRTWGTYFGGNDVDYITGMLLDANNNIIFSGSTESTNAISTAGAYQPTLAVAMNYDGYFAKFSPAGKQKLGTYFGGTNTDYAKGIAMDNSGKIYIAGETQSTNAIASAGAYVTTAPGSGDAYLARFCLAPEPVVTPATTQTVCIGSSFTLTTQSGFTYLWNSGSTSNPLTVTASNPPGIYNYVVKATDAFGCDGFSDTTKVIFSVCTGVEELQGQAGLTLFPVPAGDHLTIAFENITADGHTTVEVFSALGEKLVSCDVKTSTLEIPVAGYAPGIYLARITINNNTFEKKFIKQ